MASPHDDTFVCGVPATVAAVRALSDKELCDLASAAGSEMPGDREDLIDAVLLHCKEAEPVSPAAMTRNLADLSRPVSLIFLDVDGVLNKNFGIDDPDKYMTGTPYMLLSKACVARLTAFLLASEARIVLSSTWRTSMALKLDLWQTLVAAGMPGDRLVGQTEDFAGLSGRDEEIRAWLQTLPADDIASWAVLDDMDLHDRPGLSGHFVKTDPAEGFTEDDAEVLFQFLHART
eukprot:TRINITY_DN46380_c0_g1_i1.p1 TRINITY_DN46380_c0_g1~~TRINITY_DN46380_c0_g1_i1.p1  ORF type:complete len:233 (-),score=44.76 TRINITY_DN46380_c0_g1_i1:54-752(-)